MLKLARPRKNTQSLINTLFNRISKSPERAERQLTGIAEKFQQAMAKAVEFQVNQFIVDSKPTSLEEFQKVAMLVNCVLEKTGQCAQSQGKPGLLVGELADARYLESGHLSLLVPQSSSLIERIRIYPSDPNLVLMPLYPEAAVTIHQLYRQPRIQNASPRC